MWNFAWVGALSSAIAVLAIAASATDLQARIRALVDSQDLALAGGERTGLQALYHPDAYAPLWLDAARRPTATARDALQLLREAGDDGLNPADYDRDLLDRLMRNLDTVSPALPDAASFDVALSAGLLRYLRHLHGGRVDARALGFRLEGPRVEPDVPALIRSASATGRIADAATGVMPALEQYRALRGMLARYRSLARDRSSIALPFTTTVHPGEQYAARGALHRQLAALGDLSADAPVPSEAGRYEGTLVDGVKRFQIRHGLEPDGVLGKNTAAALRVPLPQRIRQIELALERLRWLPQLADGRVIVLNIPMFRVWAWDRLPPAGAPLLGMNAIVGRALRTPTPVLIAAMDEVIFRPPWNVPQSILRNEVLPKIERDPDYLRRENMEIVGGGDDTRRPGVTSATLAGLRSGALRVRQRPGPKNALGLIKFEFPNKEGVYLHGTPAQALFDRSRRDFSHGCVRIADPATLAEWVLRDLPEWTRDRILAATTGSQTLHVKLPRPITVVFFYTTAAVMPSDGAIRFAEDIYQHDARLERALVTRLGGQ